MASSGSFNTTAYSGRYLTFSWTLQSQDPAANTSTIAWTLKGAGGNSGYYISGNFKVVIAGETVYSSATRIELYPNTVVASGTKVITHNTDGTKNFSASAEAGIYYVAVNCSGSGSWDLDYIPRTSTISCPSTAIGSTARIAINRASTNFWHEVTYKFGSLSGNCGVSDTTYLNWTIPNSFYDEMGNYTSKSCTLTCYTYINGSTTLVGTSTTSFLVTIDADDSKPVLDVELYDDNDTTTYLTGDSGTMIRYYSDVHYDMNNSYAQNGADIVSYQAVCGSRKRTAAEDIFTSARSEIFTFTITDSRGATVSQEIIMPVIDYIDLDCNLRVGNPTVSGNITITISGTYFNGSFGRMNNSLAVEYRYKEVNGTFTSWKNAGSPSISGNSYTVTTSISGLDSTKTYVFEARAIDELEVAENTADGVKSEPIFDWGANDFRFNVPMATNSDYNANGAINAKGSLNLIGEYVQTTDANGEFIEVIDPGKEGGNVYFSYGHYSNDIGTTYYNGNKITMRSNNDVDIKSNDGDVNIDAAGGIYLNGQLVDIETGDWSPLFYGIDWDAREGYYMRIGEMCVINFSFEGTATSDQAYCRCPRGYLPYYADEDNMSTLWLAGGGGNVTGGTYESEESFTGFTIESDGHIYARTCQDVASSGEKRSGYVQLTDGDSVYITGTIMYKIDPTELSALSTVSLLDDEEGKEYSLYNPEGELRRRPHNLKESREPEIDPKEGNA